MPPLQFTLTRDPIAGSPAPWDGEFGAEICFYGVVRGAEDGEPIAGIDYTAYHPMVRRRAEALGRSAAGRFPHHRAAITHRYGFVPAAEPSLFIQVGSRHSAAALEICEYYLAELKSHIPIWKEIVPRATR